jgi:hypothetical protein
MLSRTLTPWNCNLLNVVNSGYMLILKPEDINNFLLHEFKIVDPIKYNETPIKYLKKSDLDQQDIKYIEDNLIDLDMKYWDEINATTKKS